MHTRPAIPDPARMPKVMAVEGDMATLARRRHSSLRRSPVASVIHRSEDIHMLVVDTHWGRASYIRWACNRLVSFDKRRGVVVPLARLTSVPRWLPIIRLHRVGIFLVF